MMTQGWQLKIRPSLVVVCVVAALILPARAAGQAGDGGRWWEVTPEPAEVPLPDHAYPYSQIAPRLREIEMGSDRVRVEVIGRSAGGRNLFLVTISAPEAMGRLGQYQAVRRAMLEDPEHAQARIEQAGDFKVPFLINAGIHGNEATGVDAAMRLIETLATDNGEEVQAILDNLIVLINVVANPDGRVMGTQGNANGMDLHRDFLTQSQPETRAAVKVLAEWNPMVMLDLHGYEDPMRIQPFAPPHNPNYETDLYSMWALTQAEAMAAELLARTGNEARIPARDDRLGWDDWPPTYPPAYAIFHGGWGHTLEAPYRGERGVSAHYAAVWGALNFAVQYRMDMIVDQIEIFRRGFLALPQQPVPADLLARYPQLQNKVPSHLPAAYVIPAGRPFQLSAQAPARLIDFLLFNDLRVEQAGRPFTLEGVTYPAGTYLVWMDQPKRGLANAILSDGLDLSDLPNLEFDSAPTAWSHPALWGVYRVAMEEPLDVAGHAVTKADPARGSVEGGQANAFAYLPTSIAAIQATNDLLARGVPLLRAPGPFFDGGLDFDAGVFILPTGTPDAKEIANELAREWGLELYGLRGVPAGAIPLRAPRIAACIPDAGGAQLLARFGFAADAITLSDLNAGTDLADYDLLLNAGVHLDTDKLNEKGKAALTGYLTGGKDYIGIGSSGALLAGQMSLFAFTPHSYEGSRDSILRLDYNPSDPVGAGFGPAGYGFANGPLTFTGLAAEVQLVATIAGADFLVSGYWPDWPASGAAGQPIVIRWARGTQDVTLIGLDPVFRGHPEDSFRLVANAIYSGLE